MTKCSSSSTSSTSWWRRGGWVERSAADVDKATRLIVDDLAAWLQDTQPAAVEKFIQVAGPSWAGQLADIVSKDLDKGPGRALTLLRGSKKVKGGVRFTFCQFKPANDLNPTLVGRYDANRLTVVQEAPVASPTAPGARSTWRCSSTASRLPMPS